jgi:dipeptidyl aminopeptidase/acylaminoacyl peptidase
MNLRRLDGFFAAFSLSLVGACAESSTAPRDRIVEGVDVTRLFAPPSQVEVTAMLDEWATRDVRAAGVQEVESTTVSLDTTPATLRIVSHDVAGVRHFGAILAPSGAAPGSLPVLVITHGGDHGVDLSTDALPFLDLAFGDLVADFVYVAPSFRSEPLSFSGRRYVSGGEPSPWDRDVDDALALLNVALQTTPQADSGRIGVLGFSRGACVALLMGIRDPRIDLVVEYFGPTDFFGPFVEGAVEQALRGSPPDLPGADYINGKFIQPLKRGELTIEDVRPELLRRSPVYFASRLPQVQVHHGTADPIVPVGEAERLIQVMQALGRTAPEFESYIYPGGVHNPLTFPGAIERTRDFLRRLVTGPALAMVR